MHGTTARHRPAPSKSRPGRKPHGIYLASVLLVIALLAMMLGAAVRLVEGTAVNGSTADIQAALDAANSGLRYARARLAENYHWRGDGNGVMVNTPDLVVQEDNGNVTGIIKASGGQYAQFRIRFNFQNGNSQPYETGVAAPGMANPTTPFTDDPYVSINNIDGMGSAPVYRANGPGASVTTGSPTPYDVPSATACVIVEGRAGPAMRDLSPSSLNPKPINGDHYSQKVVEAFFQAAGGPSADASVEAGGDTTFNLESGNGTVDVTAKNGNIPAIRSHTGKVTVSGGASTNYISPHGDIYAPGGLGSGTNPDSTVTLKTQDSGNFYKLSWSQVKKASSSDPHLKAGTYVVENGSLVYYPMSYSDFTTYVNTNNALPSGGTAAALPSDMAFVNTSGNNYQLQINGNVYVSAATNSNGSVINDSSGNPVNGLAFIPEGGIQQNPAGAAGTGNASAFMAQLSAATIEPGQSSNSYYSGMHTAAVWGGINPTSTSALATGINYTDGGGNTYNLHAVMGGDPDSPQTYVIIDGPSGALTDNASARTVIQGILTSSTVQSSTTGAAIIQELLSTVSNGGGQVNSKAASTTVRANNLSVKFPTSGQSAILSADGNITLGANAQGNGSITTDGNLNMVAPGSSISAPDTSGVSLFANGNVNLSTLQQPPAGQSTSSTVNYNDFIMNGVIYACGSFQCDVGYSNTGTNPGGTKPWGSFTLDGGLVAYGGDPSSAAGPGSSGTVTLSAQTAKITYDPKYLVMMDTNPPPGPLTRTFYTQY